MSRFSTAPGGLAFLVAHEVRLWLRGPSGGKRTKLWPYFLMAAFPVAGGIGLAVVLAKLPQPTTPDLAVNIASLAMLAIFLFMVPTATAGVLRTLYERADLDLLLAAPIPPDRVLRAKALGILIAAALPILILIGPFLLIPGIFAGHWRLLAGFAMILLLAVVATAIAFAGARAMNRLLGPRRARTVTQIVGGAIGAVLFLGFQAQNIAPQASQRLAREFAALKAPPFPLNLPGRAARGDPLPFLAMVALAAAATRRATRYAATMLGETPAAPRASARRRARTRPVAFAASPSRALFDKEMRGLTRDPELLAEIARRVIFLIPALFLVFRGEGFDPARIASAATVFAGFLASSFAWVIICAEESPDLIAAAPVARARVLRAKLLAACLIPLALASALAVLAASIRPWAGAVAITMAVAAAVAAATLQSWFGRPGRRSGFRKQGQENFILGFAELSMVGLLASAAYGFAHLSPIGFLPATLAVGILYAAAHGRPDADGAGRRIVAAKPPRAPRTRRRWNPFARGVASAPAATS